MTLSRIAQIVAIGGGVMGASTAYHLALKGCPDVLRLEREPFLGQGATGKCAGGIRYQVSHNVALQWRLGVETKWPDGDGVRRTAPQLEAGDVIAGVEDAGDGLADPTGVVAGYIAAGLLMAEMILDGQASSLDISSPALGRCAEGQLIREYNVI